MRQQRYSLEIEIGLDQHENSTDDSSMTEKVFFALAQAQKICEILYQTRGQERANAISAIYQDCGGEFNQDDLAKKLQDSLKKQMAEVKFENNSAFVKDKILIIEMLLNSFFGSRKIRVSDDGQLISYLTSFRRSQNYENLSMFYEFLKKEFKYVVESWSEDTIKKCIKAVNLFDSQLKSQTQFEELNSLILKMAHQPIQIKESPTKFYPFLLFDKHLIPLRLHIFSRDYPIEKQEKILMSLLIVSLPYYYQELFTQVKYLVKKLLDNKQNKFLDVYFDYFQAYNTHYRDGQAGQVTKYKINEILLEGINNSELVLIPTRALFGITAYRKIYCNIFPHLVKKQASKHRNLTVAGLCVTLLHQLSHLMLRKIYSDISLDASFTEYQKQQFESKRKYNLSDKILNFLQESKQKVLKLSQKIDPSIKDTYNQLKENLFYCYFEQLFSRRINIQLVNKIEKSSKLIDENEESVTHNNQRILKLVADLAMSKLDFRIYGQSQCQKAKLNFGPFIEQIKQMLRSKNLKNKLIFIRGYLNSTGRSEKFKEQDKALSQFIEQFRLVVIHLKNQQQVKELDKLATIFLTILLKIDTFENMQAIGKMAQEKEQTQMSRFDKLIQLALLYLKGQQNVQLLGRLSQLFTRQESRYATRQFFKKQFLKQTNVLERWCQNLQIKKFKQIDFKELSLSLSDFKLKSLGKIIKSVFNNDNHLIAASNIKEIEKAIKLQNEKSAIFMVTEGNQALQDKVQEIQGRYLLKQNLRTLLQPFQQCRKELESGWIIQQMLFKNLHKPGQKSKIYSEDYHVLDQLCETDSGIRSQFLREKFGNKGANEKQNYQGPNLNLGRFRQHKEQFAIQRDNNGCLCFSQKKNPKP